MGFYFAREFGSYSVGLDVVEQYDHSRTYGYETDSLGSPFQGERARPLQTLIWYPAGKDESSPHMTVADYFDLWATERSFGRPRMPERAKEWRSGMKSELTAQLHAIRGARRAPGRFPVVIYAPGHSSPAWENADLCEYLASHGFVVIATPSMGSLTRYPTMDLAGVEPQARDISFLVGYAQTLPNADVSKVAVAGFSWGGLCNVYAAARDNRIRALIALDGGVRFHPGLVRKAADVIPEQMTIPLLSISQGQWTPEEQAMILDENPDYDGADVLNAWRHGDLVNVHLLGFTHGEHSSMVQRNEDMWDLIFKLYPAKKADYGRGDAIIGYAWLAEYTLQFLNAYLKDDEAARAFLKRTPAENGVPRRFMTVNFRAAVGPPASMESFRRAVGIRGFAHLEEIYSEFRKAAGDFELAEHFVTDWAQQLIESEHLPEAVALLELNAEVNSESGVAYASLGNAFQLSGRPSLAIDCYRRALDKGPSWAVSHVVCEIERLAATEPTDG